MATAKVQMHPSGTTIDLLDPKPEQIHIEDIAHALAMLPRWTGATRFPYTVGQHSIWCYKHVLGKELGLQALLHDAMEAYLNDICSPLKKHLYKYQIIEGRMWSAIAERFGLPEVLDERVKSVDVRSLILERAVLKGEDKIVSNDIRYQHWTKTKREFLDTFHRLTDPNYDTTNPALIACHTN